MTGSEKGCEPFSQDGNAWRPNRSAPELQLDLPLADAPPLDLKPADELQNLRLVCDACVPTRRATDSERVVGITGSGQKRKPP